jgi:hypothetical protein
MARKQQLRVQRTGTVINMTSKQQESDIVKALVQVIEYLDMNDIAERSVLYCFSKYHEAHFLKP